MFKLGIFLFKTSLFAIAVLILGQIVSWKGRTVSDQIKIGMSQVKKLNSKHEILPTERERLKNLIRDLNK